jgi:hypothetical protein
MQLRFSVSLTNNDSCVLGFAKDLEVRADGALAYDR